MSRYRKPQLLTPEDEAAVQRYQRRDGAKRKYPQEIYAAIARELEARAGEHGLVMDLARKYGFPHQMISEMKNGYRNARRQALRQNRRLRTDTAKRRQSGRTALETEVREIVREAVDRLTGSKSQRDLTTQDYRLLAEIFSGYTRLFRAQAQMHTETTPPLPAPVTYAVGDTLELINTKDRVARINGISIAPGDTITVVLAHPWHSQESGDGGPWGVQGYTASLLKQIAADIRLMDGTVIYQG
ncbi:MAG: hypothetical protein HC828_03050 [Blastochloris sp.]|nr:hypothetical protein [Blastochloris sp.]